MIDFEISTRNAENDRRIMQSLAFENGCHHRMFVKIGRNEVGTYSRDDKPQRHSQPHLTSANKRHQLLPF